MQNHSAILLMEVRWLMLLLLFLFRENFLCLGCFLVKHFLGINPDTISIDLSTKTRWWCQLVVSSNRSIKLCIKWCDYKKEVKIILAAFKVFRLYSEETESHATITCYFEVVFKEDYGREITWYKLFSQNVFRPDTKTKTRRFQIPPIWKAFPNLSVFVTD